jgi:hypothetical protein
MLLFGLSEKRMSTIHLPNDWLDNGTLKDHQRLGLQEQIALAMKEHAAAMVEREQWNLQHSGIQPQLEKLPSIEWKKLKTYGHPWQNKIALALLCLQILCRLYFLAKEPEGFWLPGLILEPLFDPLMWLWSGWYLFTIFTMVNVPVGTFDCPHCGETSIGGKRIVKAPIGYVSRCWSCKNECVKRSAPPLG